MENNLSFHNKQSNIKHLILKAEIVPTSNTNNNEPKEKTVIIHTIMFEMF